MNNIRKLISVAAAFGLLAWSGFGNTNYNPTGCIGSTSSWTEVAGLPAARCGLAADVLNGALYAIGGENSIAQTNVYRYDGTNWTEVAGLPAARRFSAAGVLNGALYTIGGHDGAGTAGGAAQTNVYRYDGTNWTEVAGLPVKCYDLTVGVLNDALYAVGCGDTNWLAVTNVYCYDGTNWTEVAGLPAPRFVMAAGVLNGALYAIGGFTVTAQTNVYRYDGMNWTEVAGLPAPLGGLAAGVLNGMLYAVAGWNSTPSPGIKLDATSVQTNVYRFNGTNWTETASLPTSRVHLAAGVLNESMYAIGGGETTGWDAKTNVYRLTVSRGVSPNTSPITGGVAVTISGTNLCNGTQGDANVILCGVTAAVTSVAGSTQIVVTAGAGEAGLGDVVVSSAEYGMTVAANAFTYLGPGMRVFGTNGTVIESGASASSANGTDFGSFTAVDTAMTHTFSITNSGNQVLLITGVSTSGSGSACFSFSNLPSAVAMGTVSNFSIVFTPSACGEQAAAFSIVNNSGINPYVLKVKGTVANVISAGVCADYDGDRKADPAIYDEATGTWKIRLSLANYYLVSTTVGGLGGPGRASVVADYDGDRKADPAVYLEATGRWVAVLSSTDYTVVVALSQTLGGAGYSGMAADYDGDRLADPGVYQRDLGDWKVLLSSGNYSLFELSSLLGGTGYRAVAADYDGDHKADPAIYGESSGGWVFRLSEANYTIIILAQTLGGTGYIPVPADYDGDGKADPAVRSETGNEWIVMLSSNDYTPIHLTLSFE